MYTVIQSQVRFYSMEMELANVYIQNVISITIIYSKIFTINENKVILR